MINISTSVFILVLCVPSVVFGQDGLKLIQICDVCTCSEIPDERDDSYVVLNIHCSEQDQNYNFADLDKISWPPNPNGLKITATFEGLKLTTLGKLPPNSQVETLRFSNNVIKTYWPDPFNDVPNLRNLSFSQNELVEITPDLFTNMKNLEELDLSYNKLVNFNSLDFKALHQVKRLNLQSNQIKQIPIDALIPMSLLEDLDLSRNNIQRLLLQKSDSETLAGLKRLHLSGNRIRSVMKDSFPQSNSLEFLDLSSNIIEIVEEDAFLACTKLRELNLAQNNITLIFALPPSLQIAILKINALYHWPKFPNGIEYIDLSYNRLSGLYNENSVNFDSLEVLKLGGNQIKDFNLEKKLPNLYSLDLSYNFLTEVPQTLSTQYLPKLYELHLDGNIFESIYFKEILVLKSLFMTDLPRLVVVEEKAFSNVVGRGDDEMQCFALYLSGCPSLSEIQRGAFDGTSLCMLDISRNNLSYISKDLLDWSSLSDGVDLQFNPWDCTCSLQWLVDSLLPKMYNTQFEIKLTEIRCASPEEFRGRRLMHWFKWADKVMCDDLRLSSYVEPSTERNGFDYRLLYIVAIVTLIFIALCLIIYLIKTRKKYRLRRAAMKRKRQTSSDVNGFEKDQCSVLYKA